MGEGWGGGERCAAEARLYPPPPNPLPLGEGEYNIKMNMSRISVQAEPFDIAAVQDELRADNPAIGALVSFIGLMRDMNEGDEVSTMTLEHYPGMTEKALEAIVAEADELLAGHKK